jgi:hypothetical protein
MYTRKKNGKLKFRFLFEILCVLFFSRHTYTSINYAAGSNWISFFCSHAHHITLNSIVFLSSSFASIVSSKKGLLSFLFFFFLHTTKACGKRGNEMHSLFILPARIFHLCALQRNQQTDEKNEKEEPKKKRGTTPQKSGACIHGCLM